MSDTILDTETYREGVKKVGPGSEFRYRCKFDPTPGDEGRTVTVSHKDGKKLFVIAGPNGSGKSSLVRCADLDIANDRIINPDNYARGISEVEDESVRYRLALEVCRTLREKLLEAGESFGFETKDSTPEKIDIVRRAKRNGYEFIFLFVCTETPNICIDRIAQRVAAGGHHVSSEVVVSSYICTLTHLQEYIKLADRADIYDNSGNHLKLVCTKKDGRAEITPEGEEIDWVCDYLMDVVI